ncbi:hypothetical protein ARAM_006959 [Aspergillus rambellii]|uniref:PH domain-containing protein n=1 Tax=Aspergillus rambellii TaxID=308745 RepID=A0A0F8XCI6_9EURO|nr:hypothetical protein ARAM_006959 [Aspergillus rambellii]
MSDTQKPVEETPAAEAPAAETPAAEAVPQETPAETTDAAPAAAEESKADAPAEEAKEEVVPASEGVLGYKAPGLVKGLRFSKRFFYFSDDAVESKQLSAYRASEKPAVANPVVAWASQTGKGLLFLAKRAEDKATPAGIISLAEISDIAKEGSNEFHFKLSGHKYTFQASSAAERDSWIAALEAKSAEAKAEKETITSSEGYKAELEKLAKPAVVEPTKKAAEPEEEAAPAPAEETKVDAKSRSRSRKRASIFGSLLGKKEETEEKKAEEEEDIKAEEAKPAETAAAEPAAEDEAAPAPAEEPKEETEHAAPASKSKRASLFGNFFQKVTSPSHEKSEKEAGAATETAPVASTAPQLDNPVEETAKPSEPESATAAAAEDEAATAEPPAAETSTKDKRRTSFFSGFGKKKGDSDTEGAEGDAKTKSNKLGGIFRKPSKAVKPEAKEPASEAEAKSEPAIEESPAEEAAKPAEEPVAEEPQPVVAATAATTPVQAAA